jgi:ankyrin repeat protein
MRIEKSDAIRERLVRKLLAAGADPNASRKGITPLLLASRHGTSGIVKALLAAGAKTTNTDNKMRNALLRAATANQAADLIAPLLKSDIDLNAVDSGTNLSAIGIYAMFGNLEACTALLAAGADPNAKSPFGYTPLEVAANGSSTADEDNVAVFSLLLEHGAKPEAEDNTKPGMLFGAIVMRRSSLIKSLVDAGAPVNKEMYRKIMPVALAAAASDRATLKTLLDLGADPKTLDVKGISPLAHAAAAGRADNMKLLLDRGVSPDATDPLGVPPIWVAAYCGQTRAVRLLLAAGAKPDAIHPTHKTTALETARARHDPALVTLLEATAPVK